MKYFFPVVVVCALFSCAKPPTEKEAREIANRRVAAFLVERYHDVDRNLKPELKSIMFNNEMWSFSYRIKNNESKVDIIIIVDNKRNAEISIDEIN